MKKPPPKRPLTPEEKKLWELVTKNDKKLRVDDSEESPPEPTTLPVTKIKYRPFATHNLKPNKESNAPELGKYAGIDKNTAGCFRKGNYPIDGTLDLHGMTAAKAHAALIRFINSHHQRQSRALIIITGKGTLGEGVLKKSLPGWLAHEDLSPMILAFDTAKAKDGGSGAYYVLLRRIRARP